MKLSEDLYVYPWQDPQVNNCNTYLIAGATPTLIDPGLAPAGGGLAEDLARDGFPVERIRLVIDTHGHPDHIGANDRFAGAETPVAIHEADYRLLEDHGRRLFVEMGLEPPQHPFDLFLEEGELLLGGEPLQVLHTPGHSPGSICIYWPKYRALFSGDTLFALGVGRVDLPGGDPAALARSIERLSKLDIEYLFPGHGQMLQGAHQIRRILKMISGRIAQFL
jgi:glyoxylase-like metal-dependent hydrolase (beta-lactamase superfamily II)